jgi:hypothetical protein
LLFVIFANYSSICVLYLKELNFVLLLASAKAVVKIAAKIYFCIFAYIFFGFSFFMTIFLFNLGKENPQPEYELTVVDFLRALFLFL